MKSATTLFFLLSILSPSNGVNYFYTTIPEGYVGIYYYLNKIQNELVQDFTMYNSITSNIQLVKIVQDNDYVNNVKCISKEGIYLTIPQIEIANKIKKENVIDIIKNYGIDYDKKLVVRPIAQFIRELCAERTIDEIVITDFHLLDNLLKTEIQRQVDEIDSGITIDYVRITSVDFPDDIRNLRLEKEKEKNNKGIQEEAMKTEQVKKNKEAMVAKLDNERLLQDVNAEKERNTVENNMILETAKINAEKTMIEAKANANKTRVEADAHAYKMTAEYEGYKQLYSLKDYADVEKVKSISSKTSVILHNGQLPLFMSNKN